MLFGRLVLDTIDGVPSYDKDTQSEISTNRIPGSYFVPIFLPFYLNQGLIHFHFICSSFCNTGGGGYPEIYALNSIKGIRSYINASIFEPSQGFRAKKVSHLKEKIRDQYRA